MLALIAKNDWRNLRAERTLWPAAILLGFTILYGVHNGASWVRFQRQTISAAVADQAERHHIVKTGIENANAGKFTPAWWKDPRSPWAVGNQLGSGYAVMPPAPLGALAVGQSDLLPYYVRVTVSSRDTMLGYDEIENPVHLLSGRFDLAFVIIYLFPLFILALSYNLISAEKEDGTLQMTLAQPVSIQSVALAKAGLRALFVLALATVLSVGGALLSGVDLAAPGAITRLLAWIAVVAAYSAFWFGLAVAVNTLGRSSATNALALSGLWLAFVLLIPSLLNVFVKAAHPVPSRVEMIQAIRRASDDLTAQRSKLMARFFEDHPEFSPPSDKDAAGQYATRNLVTTEEMERRIQPMMAAFDEKVSRQQELVDRYRFLSPAVLTQAALYDLAGTGVGRYKHFLRQTGEYHDEWQSYFRRKMVQSVRLTAANIDELPRWRWREENTAEVLGRIWGNLTGLLLAAALVCALGLRALKRYPVVG